MTQNQAHSRASALVRSWRPRFVGPQWYNADEKEGESFRLEFPTAGTNLHTVSVSFTKIEGRPDVMRVRSTNWRCEHEPSGIVAIEDCRAFFRQLTAAGFETF